MLPKDPSKIAEYRTKLSASKQGHIVTAGTRAKISAKLSGRKLSAACISKLRGRKRSAEAVAKGIAPQFDAVKERARDSAIRKVGFKLQRIPNARIEADPVAAIYRALKKAGV